MKELLAVFVLATPFNASEVRNARVWDSTSGVNYTTGDIVFSDDVYKEVMVEFTSNGDIEWFDARSLFSTITKNTYSEKYIEENIDDLETTGLKTLTSSEVLSLEEEGKLPSEYILENPKEKAGTRVVVTNIGSPIKYRNTKIGEVPGYGYAVRSAFCWGAPTRSMSVNLGYGPVSFSFSGPTSTKINCEKANNSKPTRIYNYNAYDVQKISTKVYDGSTRKYLYTKNGGRAKLIYEDYRAQ